MARVELRMRTFIPYDHIPSPTNSNQRFLGDVRKSAIWGSSAYRTSQSWIVDTSSSTNFITAASKNTGITYKQRYENGLQDGKTRHPWAVYLIALILIMAMSIFAVNVIQETLYTWQRRLLITFSLLKLVMQEALGLPETMMGSLLMNS